MGWVIRYIKDRDMSTENIAMAISRMILIRSFPPEIITKAASMLGDSNALGQRSLIRPMVDIINQKGPRPGSFAISVTHSRRNTDFHSPKDPGRLRQAITQHFTDIGASTHNICWEKVGFMKTGMQ